MRGRDRPKRTGITGRAHVFPREKFCFFTQRSKERAIALNPNSVRCSHSFTFLPWHAEVLPRHTTKSVTYVLNLHRRGTRRHYATAWPANDELTFVLVLIIVIESQEKGQKFATLKC